MAKQLTTKKLEAYTNHNSVFPRPAKQCEYDKVTHFCDMDSHGMEDIHGMPNVVLTITREGDDAVVLATAKGEYTLDKHPKMNYFHGTCNGVKVQVSLKQLVGEIRFWA